MDADRTGTPQGGAARVRRHKYFAQQSLGAGAIHLPRAYSIPLGWSDHRERNPKIRPSAFGRWSYFWVPLSGVAPPQGNRTCSGQVKCGEAGHSVQAALFRSASVPYGLPCRIKYDDAEHRHRPAVSCIQFAFFSFAISSAIWRHMSLRNFTSSSKSSMRERGTSFS